MKAINISRVSSEDQKENSPEAQSFRMNSYCKNKHFEIIKEFDFIESAYKLKRDTFDEIMEYIEKVSKKEKVAVCFDKVDRLSRNIFDKRVAKLYEMAIGDKIELHFVSDGQVIDDKMSAGDKFAFGMKLGLAKYYSDAISDNVKRAFEQKRRNGEWTGRVRLGYLRFNKDIIIDPDRAYLIQKMFELYATNQHSLETIRTKITRLGLRSIKGNKLSKSCIDNILRDSFFCGMAISKYGPYIHKYPKLITRELFDKCKEIRSQRKKLPYKSHSRDFIFKGLLKCPNCGCSMSPEQHKKPSGLVYNLYSCTNAKGVCKKVYINENELLKPVYEVLERFGSISEDTQEKLVAELRKSTEAEAVFHKAQISRIRNAYDSIQEKQNNLLDVLIDKSITKDVYDKKHQELKDKMELLEIEMSEYQNADYNYQTTVAIVISVARRAKTIFEKSSDIAGKRTFLTYILQNPTLNEKTLGFTLRSPFNLVLELADNPNWLGDQDLNPDKQDQNLLSYH